MLVVKGNFMTANTWFPPSLTITDTGVTYRNPKPLFGRTVSVPFSGIQEVRVGHKFGDALVLSLAQVGTKTVFNEMSRGLGNLTEKAMGNLIQGLGNKILGIAITIKTTDGKTLTVPGISVEKAREALALIEKQMAGISA